MNAGLINKLPRVSDWRFGGFTAMEYQVLQHTGQWKAFLPNNEKQHAIEQWKFDSQGCVSFSALNCLEIMFKKRYGRSINFSDRFLAKVSGTTTRGNWLYRVADAIREYGVVNEVEWLFNPVDQDGDGDFDWDDFYKEIPEEILRKGKASLELYDFHYEWVDITSAIDKMYALRFSPLQITVPYPSQRDAINGIIHTDKWQSNHALTLVGYKEGKYWLVFDHYAPFTKKLAWDYPIDKMAMRFNIKEKTMKKPNLKQNALVFEAEGAGRAGLFIDDKIVVDDLAKILMQYEIRNKGEHNTVNLTTAQFDLFEHVDFKSA